MNNIDDCPARLAENNNVVREVSAALDDLPIFARLELVANLLLSNGGQKDSLPQRPGLVLAFEVVAGVIKVLEAHPIAAQLRSPQQ